MNYYNEIDPFAAQWLRELIKAGHLPQGDVDERSIEDILPDELAGYTQCHFFAGIGGWSYALKLAGIPETTKLWTGSCPCQPFSQAGKGKGFDDERHLWPAFFWLIQQCRPRRIYGEQSANAGQWIDLVSTDLEAEGYTFAAAVLGAHSVSAPHMRQRFYWMADADSQRRNGINSLLREEQREDIEATGRCSVGELGNSMRQGLPLRQSEVLQGARGGHEGRVIKQSSGSFWSDCDWLPCTDGKARPVESGSFPLAYGIPARVGRLRGYGNAIVPQVAAIFMRSIPDELFLPKDTP